MKNRFFLSERLEGEVSLKEGEFHHLAHVLRLKINDPIELVNGKGDLAQGTIQAISRHEAHIHIVKQIHEAKALPQVSLGIGWIRLNRLEWAIEKGTELGAHAFYLFAADRSEIKQLTSHQIARLEQIAIGAMKQSGCLYLPSIEIFDSLEELPYHDQLALFGAPTAHYLLPSDLKGTQSILFVSGPEGGFSPQEHAYLAARGKGVRLHAHILRAETAPIVALSILQSILRTL